MANALRARSCLKTTRFVVNQRHAQSFDPKKGTYTKTSPVYYLTYSYNAQKRPRRSFGARRDTRTAMPMADSLRASTSARSRARPAGRGVRARSLTDYSNAARIPDTISITSAHVRGLKLCVRTGVVLPKSSTPRGGRRRGPRRRRRGARRYRRSGPPSPTIDGGGRSENVPSRTASHFSASVLRRKMHGVP